MGEYNELYHHGVKGQKWGIRRTPVQLGHSPKGQSADDSPSSRISFTKEGSGFYTRYRAKTNFGGNPDCLIFIDRESDKQILDRILKDKNLEKTMREHSSEMHQYEAINVNHEPKEQFSKRLKCEQITIDHDGNPNIVSVWYAHPDDSGAWYMQVNSKNGYIEDEQYMR